MSLHNAMHEGQPYTGALELILAVQTMKHLEQLIGLAHVETGAVVTYEIDILDTIVLAADFNLRIFFQTREFERIGQQVAVNLAQQHRVR